MEMQNSESVEGAFAGNGWHPINDSILYLWFDNRDISSYDMDSLWMQQKKGE